MECSKRISRARQFMAALAQVSSFSDRGSLKDIRHALEVGGSRLNPMSQ